MEIILTKISLRGRYSISLIVGLILFVGCEKTPTSIIEEEVPIEVPEEVINPNYPEFSWDTMPLYMHVRKNTAFTKDEIEYLSEFPLVTIEKSTGYTSFGSNEKGTLEAAKEIKSLNAKTRILYYKNVVINWANYEEDEAFLKEYPNTYLTNQNSEKVYMPNGTTAFFDISQEYVRDYWLDHVNQMVESDFLDGVFLDANIKVLVPSFFSSRVGDAKQQDIEEGYFTMMEDLDAQIGDTNLLLANIIRVRPEFSDNGREFLHYFDGSYLEGFDHENFGMTYAEYVAAGIEAVQKSAREGKIIALSLGIGESLNGSNIGIDDERESIDPDEDLSERLDYLLGLFLVCAEKYSYVYPHDGYNSLTSAVWLKTFTQYKNRLGAPKGYATKEGYVYKRSFEYLDLTLDIEKKTAVLNWK